MTRHWREPTGVNRLTLPLPPSANRYWRAVSGRNILSEDGREYKEQAELVLAGQPTKILTGPVIVDAVVYFKNRRGDLDNRIKPTLDALQGYCYANDAQVYELRFRRDQDRGDPRVEVRVKGAV